MRSTIHKLWEGLVMRNYQYSLQLPIVLLCLIVTAALTALVWWISIRLSKQNFPFFYSSE